MAGGRNIQNGSGIPDLSQKRPIRRFHPQCPPGGTYQFQSHPLVFRGKADFPDIVLRHPFQPDRLPDAGYRRVPHAAPVPALLAVGQALVLQAVCGLHQQRVFFPQPRRDVKGESLIAPCVRPQKGIVQVYPGFLVHRAEVQQHPACPKALRQGEAPAVTQHRAVREHLMDAGQQRFRREGHPDLPVKRPLLPHGQRPAAVQIVKGIPPQRGPGVHIPGNPCQIPSRLRPKLREFRHMLPSFFPSVTRGDSLGKSQIAAFKRHLSFVHKLFLDKATK